MPETNSQEAAPQPTPPEESKPAAPKIKVKKRTQRACDEKDEKGKVCCGHLKRWYDYPKEIEAILGPKAEGRRDERRNELRRTHLRLEYRCGS
jgi:hypothetical protein